jgi:hypothetical protein
MKTKTIPASRCGWPSRQCLESFQDNIAPRFKHGGFRWQPLRLEFVAMLDVRRQPHQRILYDYLRLEADENAPPPK